MWTYRKTRATFGAEDLSQDFFPQRCCVAITANDSLAKPFSVFFFPYKNLLLQIMAGTVFILFFRPRRILKCSSMVMIHIKKLRNSASGFAIVSSLANNFQLVFIKNIRLLNCIERILANIKKAVEFRFSLQFQRIFCLIL